MAVAIDKYTCPFCGQKAIFVGVHDDEGNYKGRPGCEYESDPWSGLCYAIHHDGWGDCILCTDAHDLPLGGCFFDTAEEAFQAIPTLTQPNEPLTCGLVDRHGMPLRAGDTVAADKFFVYAVRYGSHNVNPDNCAPAYQVGWYLEIMWAYPGFEDSVGHTEPLYDIDGTAARYPAHCADTADGLYNLKLEVCCRPPEGDEKT